MSTEGSTVDCVARQCRRGFESHPSKEKEHSHTNSFSASAKRYDPDDEVWSPPFTSLAESIAWCEDQLERGFVLPQVTFPGGRVEPLRNLVEYPLA